MRLFICFLLFQIIIKSEDIQISTSKLNGTSVDQIIWCGDEYDYMFIRTSNGTVYRSQDRGKIFTPITEKLLDVGKDDSVDSIGFAILLVQSKVSKQTLAILGSDRVNWITNNCGKSWKKIKTEVPIKQIKFHPTNESFLLASSENAVCSDEKEDDEDSSISCRNESNLYLSSDKGDNWSVIQSKVLKYDWVWDYSQNMTPSSRIVIVKMIKANEYYLKVTDDYFKSTVYERINGFDYVVTDKFIFITDMVRTKTGELQLQVSNLGSDVKLSPIQIPVKKLKHHLYFIIEPHIGGILLFICHNKISKYGSLYKSDSTGKVFSLVLKNIPINGDAPEIEKITGLDGIIIANTYSEETVKNIQSDPKNVDYKELQKISYISFNMGSEWSLVKAPVTNQNGDRLDCQIENDCSLHFSWNPKPMHSKDAIGLIVAYGNIGNSLTSEYDLPKTFYSRDGGFTWKMLSKFLLATSFGDHGGLLLAINDTDAIYSWNEGKSWSTIDIEPLLKQGEMDQKSLIHARVNKIETTPEQISLRFIIFAEISQKSEIMAILLNFESFNEQLCQGADSPNQESSDYELWIPNSNNSCILGRSVSYVRRKKNADCYNGQDFQRPTKVENCLCTEEDYECDFGYARAKDNKCTVDTTMQYKYDYCQGGALEYNLSDGYRKIPGDSCTYGVTHSLTTKRCTLMSFNKKPVFIILGGLLIILALLTVDFQSICCFICNLCKKIPYQDIKTANAQLGHGEVSIQEQNMPTEEDREKQEQSAVIIEH
jgi:hypothetical protein